MPGMVKVGKSDQLSEDRAKQLGTTGVPLPFDLAFRVVTSHPIEVERRAHTLLADYRVSDRREFFKVEPDEAATAVRQASLQVAGIEAWDTDAPVILREGDRVAVTLRAGQIFVPLSYPLFGEPRILDIWQAHSDGDLLEMMAIDTPAHVAGFSHGDPGGDVDPVPHLDRVSEVPNGSVIGRERVEAGQRLLWLDGSLKPPACSMACFEFQSYCQVLCRTWTPKVTEEGFPLFLNHFTGQAEISPAMETVMRAALRMACPRVTAEFSNALADQAGFGSDPAQPDFWMPQLKPRQRKARRPKNT